ncbi:MAG TPA: hypothetical protein GX399_11130 [Xanthomonadaceae bacterium]|nr:hypothetical protein [Xanthomonadaceae bacterium]
MPQSFSMRLFDRWLAENRTRFRHPPTAIVRRKGSRAFRFAGVAPSVWGHVCDWGSIVVGIDHRGETWDLITDLDIAPERLAAGGYVCRFCEADARKVYPTRAAALDRARLRTVAGVVQRAFSGRPERDAFSNRGWRRHMG